MSSKSFTPENTALENYFAHLELEKGLSDNTLMAYRRDIMQFVDFRIAEVSVAGLSDTKRLSLFLAQLESSQARPATVARKISAVRGYLSFIGRESGVAAPAVKAPRLAQYHPGGLSVEMIERVIQACDDSPLGMRDRALIETLYGAGMRISEALSLTLYSTDTVTGFITIRGKGNKERLVPIGEKLRQSVERYIECGRPQLVRQRLCDALFLGKGGEPLSRIGAYRVLVRIAKAAQLDRHMSPHTLRHSFATHLLEGGADLRVTQELLGHHDISTTQRYTHPDRDFLRATVREFHPLEKNTPSTTSSATAEGQE